MKLWELEDEVTTQVVKYLKEAGSKTLTGVVVRAERGSQKMENYDVCIRVVLGTPTLGYDSVSYVEKCLVSYLNRCLDIGIKYVFSVEK